MKNYNTLNDVLKDETVNFIKNISKELGKVDTHFISDIVTGIITNNSVLLSDIARASGSTNIKKTVERLERHLDSYSEIENKILNNYIEMIKPYINKRHLYFVDRGDIVKDEDTKFENKGTVLDGSDFHNVKQGYQLNDICTIDNNNQPISLISQLRSSKDEDYDSDNILWTEHMKFVHKTYGKGTFILDRGYDGAVLMQKMIEIGSDFIVRAKCLTRDVYVNGEKTTIRNLALKHKGYYKYKSRGQSLKVYSTPIRIKSRAASDLGTKTLTLVIVKGYAQNERTLDEAYMALITSRNICGKNDVLQVVNDYTLRWRIEENFKYKKQQFKLEKIMVRKYKRIQVLNTLLSYVMFFSNVVNLKAIGKTIRKQKLHIKNEVKFWLYRISDGIKEIISFFSKEIMKIIYPKREKRRRDLWTVCRIPFRPY